MKLYYAPGACSQAPHIALREAGIEFDLDQVDLRAKRTADGGDYLAVNPKGAVPALGLDNGEVLTENAAILQYIGDQKPDSGLLPPLGELARYRVLEWLNFIATEIHKGFGPLWNPASSEETKQGARDLLAKKFDYVEGKLGSRPYLMGDRLTAPDIYLYVMLGWTRMHQVELGRWPGLSAFTRRMTTRPAVMKTLEAEGLVEAEVGG